MCQWHDWKKTKTRIRELMNLGIEFKAAYNMANSRQGDWKCSVRFTIHKAMGISYWINRGLEVMETRYFVYRESWRTAVY
jgi:RNA-directed DNA polymerase